MSFVLRSIYSCLLLFCGLAKAAGSPTVQEAIESKLDLWGEAALRQPNGPSYEFFEDLLPPLRYVNADFRQYPILLSAPKASAKARLISNGSGVNVRAGLHSWKEPGVEAVFRIGPDEYIFGSNAQRLQGPHLIDGYLPIVQLDYTHGEAVYSEEAFAPVASELADHGVVFVRFALKKPDLGMSRVSAQFRAATALTLSNTCLTISNRTVAWFDPAWRWDADRQMLVCDFKATNVATLAIASVPVQSVGESPLAHDGYTREREEAIRVWRSLLEQGMNVETPEPIVNNAWRALLLQNVAIMNGNSFRYSSGNQYDALYVSEGSDATAAMLLWGFQQQAATLLPPITEVMRRGMELNYAGQKLENIAVYYWQTRDAAFVEKNRPQWERELKRVCDAIEPDTGLLPRGAYCNDIPTPILSLNSNSKCWRGLRDLGAVLRELGASNQAAPILETAARLRQSMMSAVRKSTFTNTQPPFIPIALLGGEQPYDPICATKMGSYWNLVINFVLGFEALGPGSEQEGWLVEYIQQHGGLCMGMTRSRPISGWWISSANVNPLYGTRYVQTLLRRDEPDQALVSFYGMLAHGFTRETFITGEGNSLVPLDALGRQFSLPPNSAGNAHFLQMLRGLLIQDLDLNDDGRPETLRLGFATPRRWLEDGKSIKVQHAPTAFGPISYEVQSLLRHGQILVSVELPTRNMPAKTFFRVRVPDGWTVVSARIGEKRLDVDSTGTVELSELSGKTQILFNTKKL